MEKLKEKIFCEKSDIFLKQDKQHGICKGFSWKAKHFIAKTEKFRLKRTYA